MQTTHTPSGQEVHLFLSRQEYFVLLTALAARREQLGETLPGRILAEMLAETLGTKSEVSA